MMDKAIVESVVLFNPSVNVNVLLTINVQIIQLPANIPMACASPIGNPI